MSVIQQGENVYHAGAQLDSILQTFFTDAKKLSGTELLVKYYPVTWKMKIKTWIRKAFLLPGIYGTVKNV